MRKFILEGDMDDPFDRAISEVVRALKGKRYDDVRKNLIAIGNTALGLAEKHEVSKEG
jgi:hypothetical protein